ncbi:MAG: PorT family protein, partial [Chitinophagaceae bacterium]
LLNYKPGKILTLQAGPQFGILMDRNKNLLQNGVDAFKQGDLSMLAGAQINILSFRIYGRYVIGLSDISDLPNQEKWRNQGLQVGVGLAF